MIYIISVLITFIAVSLKGFQHKNVIGNHLKSVGLTSFLMAAFDWASVSLIVTGGWPIIITSGIGASAGMIFSIKLHDYVFKGGSPNASVSQSKTSVQ